MAGLSADLLYLAVGVVSVLVSGCGGAAPSRSWHAGCYHGNLTSYQLLEGATAVPVHCGAICLATGMPYAAVDTDHACACLPDLPTSGQRAPLDHCSTWCLPPSPLPCGGPGVYSVYLSAGPYLYNVSVRVLDAPLYVLQPMALEVMVQYAGLPNISTGLADGVEDDELQQFNLTIDYGPEQSEQRLTAKGLIVHEDDVFTYNKPGNYTIRVTASSAVSDVTTSVNVSLLLPLPAEVQLGLVTSGLTSQTPSCVPPGAPWRVEGTTLAIFTGEPAQLEASANAGYNLTFDWSFGDDVMEVSDRPADRGCEGGACLTSRMNHTYREEGVYNLTVTAHNDLGAASSIISLIAVRRELRDLSVTLDDHQHFLLTPSESVEIAISMVTTDRQDTTLEVDFGDGDVQTYLLVAHDGRFLGRLRGASDQVALRADYGDGCQLSLSLDHIYVTQGEYDVIVRVHNNHSDLSETLTPRLVVQARLQGLVVHGRRAAFAGREYTYFAEFKTPSPSGVTYNWTVVTSEGETIHSDITTIPTVNLTFPDRGMYTVHLHVENLINSENTSFSVSVHVPIQELEVSLLHGGKQIVSTATSLSFEASVSSGNGVEFEWDFHDEDADEDLTSIIKADNMTSVANHTFMLPGTYIIEVTAYNAHEQRMVQLPFPIEVRVPIKTLRLTTDSPTLKGHKTRVTAIVTGGGNHINMTLDYNGTVLPGDVTQSTDVGDDVTHTAVWSLTLDVGQTELTVTAENGVSTVTRQTVVDVEPPIDKVSLITEVKLVLGEKVGFIVLQENRVLARPDLVFTWTVDRHVVSHTRVPILEHVFTGEARNIEVSVKVANKVDSEEKRQIFEIYQSSDQPRLTQGAIKDFGYPINFTIVSLPPDCEKLVMLGREGGTASQLKEIPLAANNTSSATWDWAYATPGVYRIEVTMVPSKDIVQGTVSVQERVAGARLEGPSAARVDDTSQDVVWRVVTDNGSHILYDWIVDDKREALTPESQFRWRFTKPGHHVITVNVTNSLGGEVVRHDVYAEHSVTDLRLALRPALTHLPTSLNVTVYGGPPTAINVTYGDGTSRVVRATDRDVRRTQGDGYVTYYLNHTYVSVGRYDVTVNASNHVTWQSLTRHLAVEEPITGLRLNASHGPIVTLGTTVTVWAAFDTGRNLTFDWMVTGSVLKEADGSSVTLQLDTEGDYNVTVYVTYAQYKAYVTASLPYVIHVIQPVSDVTLRAENDARSAPLRAGRADVTFTATAVRGSGVVFTFHFGDGTNRTADGSRDRTDDVTASVSHTYTREGVYDVRVRAVNPLSDVTARLAPFYVQTPPGGCTLRPSGGIYVPHGDVTTVNVTCTAGSDVMFDWNMGDQTEYKNQSGGVTHQYRRPGHYRLVVMCYNHVDAVEVVIHVFVVTPIMGVEVGVQGDALYHPNKENVIFQVKLTPAEVARSNVQFSWDFGEANTPPVDGGDRKAHSYPYVGTYAVHVTAKNLVSQRTSAPVKVVVVEPMEAITLTIKGEPLLGRKLTFDAYQYKGSNVTYYWDFGDGHRAEVRRQKIVHTYNETGKYEVVVVASNPFGNQTASDTVFVLQTPCSPPQVTLLKGANVEERNVTRGQELKLETAISINCSITSAANYTWSIQYADTRIAVNISGVPSSVYRDPILFIPRHTLDYGRYYVRLLVEMQGTIVYGEAETFFSVVPSGLMPVISGGLQRYVQRTEDVVMNASASYDPDYPDTPDLRYRWTCYQLTKPNLNCSHTTPMALAGREVRLPGAAFLATDTNQFVFNLTVSRGGRPPFYLTSQVLEMTSQGIIDMTLACTACEDGLINSDQRLIVEAVHPGYREDELEYSWGLYTVADEDNGVSDFHDSPNCVKADGSSDRRRLVAANTNTTSPSTPANVSHTGPPGASSRGNATLTTSTASTAGTLTPTRTTSSTSSAATTTTTRTSSASGPSARPKPQPAPGGAPGSPLLFPIQEGSSQQGSPISEGHSGRRSDSSGSGRREDPGTTPPGSASGGALHTEDSPTEGLGSRRGSGSGYPQGSSGGQDPSGRPSQNGADRGTRGGGSNPAVDDIKSSRVSPHIVSMLRSKIVIQGHQTTTGTARQALVFNPGVLLQGRTYIIEGKVRHRVSGVAGTALTYVVVNQSPSQGQCSLSPKAGTEMATVFTVVCSDWKDAHLPIRYEISYSLSGRDIIYQGLNHKTTFMLPAGDAAHNHTVLVNIAILDSFGARTTVCSLPVKVKVAVQETAGALEEDLLYGLVAEENSTLQTFVSKGDNRNARLHAQLIAHRLNRLDKAGDNKTSIRAGIRTSMLRTLKELPMRDEYEVQQTTSAVAASTAVSTELDPESLDYASQILEKATHQMTRIADVTKHVDSDIITTAIQGSANVLAAASTVRVADHSRHVTKPVVERTRWSIHNLTQTELNHTVLGETPRRRDTPALHTFAGRFRISEIPEIANTTFTLPSSLSAKLHQAVAEGLTGNQRNGTSNCTNGTSNCTSGTGNGTTGKDCYEVHVVNYKRNPFLYAKGRIREVASQVASLSLFKCGGPEVPIEKLPANDPVVLAIPSTHNQVLEAPNQFELHKHEMQVHKLSVNLDPTDRHSLHIVLDLQPYSQGRLFPIALLLRPDAHPTPEHYQYKKVFPASEEKLNLFLPAHTLNESTTYYLGVVDAHFNAGRPRRGEILVRRYTIRMWRAQCVFWDEQTDEWSDRGCTIQPTSTFGSTDCWCNHLTAFGAHNSLVPNDLNFTLSVDDFFDLNENPVTFTLIVCLLGVYIVLLVVCVMADNHDQKKGAIVHLVDNSASQPHTYVITMETGMRRGAGTSAKVSLVLHGKEGMSETRELVSQSGQPLFERNSRDMFIITLPESLGQIWKVQLWHNNAGPSPNWYLSRVIVKDINKAQTFYFSCEKWFAVTEEDGRVEREIMVLDHGLGFAKVLWAKGTQYLTDYHLWFSMLCRPAYSRFTRAQRLTCCLSLVTSYMAVNAAWYRQAGREYRGEFGLVDLSWRAVAVGAITALLVLPANLLIVFLFRRSKIKKVCIEDPPEKKYDYPLLKRDSIISLDSTVRLLQPAVTPSIFDQSMLNWTTLQDWAQRQWAKRYQQPEGSLPGDQREDKAEGPGQAKTEYDTDQASSGFGDTSDLSPGNVTSPDAVTSHDLTSPRVTTPSDVIHCKRQLSDDDRRLNEDCELRRQHELDKYVLESIRSRKPRRVFLPHACRYVAWVLAAVLILGCSAVTVLYGLRFGKTKSIMWLQSLFFSFLQCVFITHPFVVLLISVYTAIKYRNDLSIFDHHDDGVIEQRTHALLQAQRQPGGEDEDLAMGIAARQRSRYLRLIRPPQEKQLIEARKQIMKEKKATSVLSESVGVVILLFLLFFVAYSKDINTPYRLNNVLKDLLTKSGSRPFSKVQTVQDWYQWSSSEMLDTLYWEKWYNGQHTAHDKGYVGNSAIVGTISLRQLRVRADRCHTADAYRLMTFCYHDYYYGNHDDRPYGLNNTWRFYESNVTRATGLKGRHAHYDGSGYQIILPNTRSEAQSLLAGLETGGWIDRHTRGVVVEFTLYSAPTNLFSSVSLLLEQSPGGGVSTQARVSSAPLFRYTTGFDNFVLACELVVVVVTLYKLHCEVGELAWYKKAYFRKPWKATEATVLLLLLAYIACFVYRFVLVYEAVELLRATYHEEFVDVSYIAYWDEILRSLLGFIILLIIVQALRLFRNRKVFARFGGVYRKAGMELLYLGLMLVVWVCAYTCLGYAVYGSLSYNFSRADAALTTVLGLLTGNNGLADLSDRASSQLFLISFLIFVVGTLTAYVVAVLTFHYRVYRDEGLPSLTTAESLTYFWKRLLQVTGLGPQPPATDNDQNTMLPAGLHISEIEHQVDEMLFKMNALSHRHGLPEKPPMYFTDSDATYGAYSPGDDGLSSGGSDNRAFDEDRFEIRLQKIEDNLMGAEPHLAQLLKLDAIGANVLPQETENQLRSALEFEIFRQLQMQRRGSVEVRSLPSDNGRVVIHRLSSLSGGSGGSGTSSTGGASSSGGSPPLTGPGPGVRPRSREPLCRTRTEMDVLSVRSKTSRDKVPRSRDHRGSRQSLSMKDALALQDVTPVTSSPDDIPLRDMTSAKKDASLGGATSAETRLLEDPVSTSSCSSGGAEVRYIVGQGQVRGQLSPVDPQTKGVKVKAKVGGSSAVGPAVTKEPSSGYEFLYTDTSSGSDQEGALRASTSSKTRSLRKTKSRGKGKGRCRLTPLEGAMDELGVDNEGYTSGSDRGEGGKGRHKT